MYAFLDDLRAPTFTPVLGVLFIGVGAGSLLSRARADQRSRQRDEAIARDPTGGGLER